MSGIHQLSETQRFWRRELVPSNLLAGEFPTAPDSAITVSTHLATGASTTVEEVGLGSNDRLANSGNSTSMARRVDADAGSASFVKGKSTNLPFRPGGLHAVLPIASPEDKDGAHAAVGDLVEIDFETDLLTIPPGWSAGAEFARAPPGMGTTSTTTAMLGGAVSPAASAEASDGSGGGTKNVISFSTLVDLDDADDDDDVPEAEPVDDDAAAGADEDGGGGGGGGEGGGDVGLEDIESVLAAPARDGRKDRGKEGASKSKTWAVVEDSSMDAFHSIVPEMARTWPFEPDTFQKQAIMHLERHECVFVAAHTSAGKTVVAEYAIALSTKHMTRCIYTSPIKALSNQKFRDFHDAGIDVGLMTGDIQINPEAACLIMTTEILRSMLYRGADLIRDVEWVIFDEVHYVNDAERGVVWEEVIIMLPEHINLILLSATVPNTFEFADWVGRTKQKNVYVISTLKRPVPLEHFLYTGNSVETSKELFKLVDQHGRLLNDGYKKANAAKTARQSDRDKSFGAKNRHSAGAGSEKGLYVSLTKMLQAKGLHPCVIFTFSKKRCETNADALMSLDMNTAQEKATIHVFIEQSVNRLKGSDRKLPQITRMRDMLKRGVGVHHGGLLPIIKEMVEMLFGKGLIKVLFATETFAMGVNMPARCVCFDTTRKHDGTGFRDLLSGEYVQMAGRAGRRGLDKTGTVIILVKGDIPALHDLNTMMLGTPTKLDSKFRLTYNMILNLLRVEELRVEDMMKRSFAENATQRETDGASEQLAVYTARLEALGDSTACEVCSEDLTEYYDCYREMLSLAHVVQTHVLAQSSKFLTVGRVVVLTTALHKNVLAVVLRAERGSRRGGGGGGGGGSGGGGASQQQYSVLLIKDQAGDGPVTRGGSGEDGMLLSTRLWSPSGPLGFDVKVVNGTEIAAVSKEALKLNVLETIDRPNPAVQMQVAQQLLRLVELHADGIPALDPLKVRQPYVLR
jgi:antiviral helicase SKI2